MSEKLSVTQAAYRKGQAAAEKKRSRKPICPYGATKLELVHWWWAGYNDRKEEMLNE